MLETFRLVERVNVSTGGPWPDGPWTSEPDQIQWRDDYTGLRCLMRRMPTQGHWCGYVGLPPQHRLHKKYYAPEKGQRGSDGFYMAPAEYDSIIESIKVHGGITFCGSEIDIEENVSDQPGDYYWWVGFDCAHSFDFTPGMPMMAYKDAKYRDVNYVQEQVTSLAHQLYTIDQEVSKKEDAIPR